jgi:hypothetical protein
MATAARFSACLLAVLAVALPIRAALQIDILQSVASLPPHIISQFDEPLGFEQGPDGSYLVFDQRGHTVYAVDAARTSATTLLEIGQEAGRIIQPRGFDIGADGSFVVADAPRGVERIQTFGPDGRRLGGFSLPGQVTPSVSDDRGFVLSGVGSVQRTDRALLISLPETGSLFTVYSVGGRPQRSIGRIRDTGYEDDRDLHLAMNAGFPLVDPTGGYFYVFGAGTPKFRKYNQEGRLLFERHIEGRELDPFLAGLPTIWPTREVDRREIPYVRPTIRAAAVDAAGQLWVSLSVPFTYVYDAHGDKVRTVQFRGAGTISPTSLSFSAEGRLLVTPGCYVFDPET